MLVIYQQCTGKFFLPLCVCHTHNDGNYSSGPQTFQIYITITLYFSQLNLYISPLLFHVFETIDHMTVNVSSIFSCYF